MSAPEETSPRPARRLRPIHLLPLVLFAALAAVFLFRLQSGVNPEHIPSALIGKPAPVFDLPPLEGTNVGGLARADLDGEVTLVNVFASWCGPCRLEHPVLEALAPDPRFRLVGINYKDQPANAVRFLNELGNPYDAIGTDESGRAGIEWGVFGVPETFVVDRQGTVVYKFIGPITPERLESQLMPEIEKALGAAG